METYFKKFPSVVYNNLTCADITRNVKIVDQYLRIPNSFYSYENENFDRSDFIADLIYNDSYYDWLIYLANGTVDPFYQWYMDNDQFNKFIEDKYVIEQETFFKNSISAKSSVSLINYFEDSINVKFQNDLSQHIKINGFDITNSKKIILLKIYEEIKAFVFPNGFTQVLEVLKNLDSKIDELYIHYKSELESLPLENSSENIKNSDLIDEIRNQSAKIEKGPGLFDRDSKFYNTEILKLNNLIKCYFDYTKKTVSLELKELICLEISKDKSEIESFKRVKDLIEKLSEKIDGKLDEKNIDDTNKSKVESLKYLATNSLIDEYHKIKNSKLISYIPNVGDFVATKDSFEDEQINIFKYSYLNECGFETLQENGVKSILRKKNQSKNIGSLNLEILLETKRGSSDSLKSFSPP